MNACPALSSGGEFLSSLLRHIDCQGRTIGWTGWETLSQPDSPALIALTSLLVIFVALFGMRMALGHATTVRDSVAAVIKIGVVLTLAGSWPAYRTVVYDLVVDGPAEITRLIGVGPRSSGEGDLIPRLQAADRNIMRLTSLGAGRDNGDPAPSPGAGAGEPPQRFPIHDDPAFGWARVFFLASAVAAFAGVRLTAGLLLALAPLVAGLLLFRVSRALVAGWARALAFTILASVATAVVLGVELGLLEPWLHQAIATRLAQGVAPSVPLELLVLCLAFALALFGALGLLLRLAFMVDPGRVVHFASVDVRSALARFSSPARRPIQFGQTHTAAPSRALAIADAVQAAQRREVSGGRASVAPLVASSSVVKAADGLTIPASSPASRQSRPRTSLAAALRDHRS